MCADCITYAIDQPNGLNSNDDDDDSLMWTIEK
jgi:hypothetical protein